MKILHSLTGLFVSLIKISLKEINDRQPYIQESLFLPSSCFGLREGPGRISEREENLSGCGISFIFYNIIGDELLLNFGAKFQR